LINKVDEGVMIWPHQKVMTSQFVYTQSDDVTVQKRENPCQWKLSYL